MGQAGERSRELVEGEDGNEASGRLLGDYESLGKAKMARTPATAPQRECLSPAISKSLITDESVLLLQMTTSCLRR